MAKPTSAGMKTTKETGEAIDKVAKHRKELMSITPLFEKLPLKRQRYAATLKSLQGYYPDNPEYSNKQIKRQILSDLGVASGEFDDYKSVGKDSAGRDVTKKQQKEMAPKGFVHGGKVCRGRKASSSAEKK